MPDLRDALHKRDQSKLEHLGRFNRVQNSLFELTFLTLYIRFLMKQIIWYLYAAIDFFFT